MSSAHKYRWTRVDGTEVVRWRAKWIGEDGRSRSKRGFDRKGDAEDYAQQREVEARHGIRLEQTEPVGRMTVEAWSKVWLGGLEVRPSTASAYRYAVQRINRSLGGRTLVALRPSELKAWRRGLTRADGRDLAPATVDATVAVLAMMLRAAVHDGLLDRSPLPPLRSGHAGTGRVVDPDQLLSIEQVHAWGAAMPEVARVMPLLAATTGLRQGELLGLRWPNVDFLRRQIRVVEQMVTPLGAGRPEWGPPKTAAGVRTVPLTKEAADALNAHRLVQPTVDGEPIFRSRRGYRWRRATFGDVWRPAAQAAGLPAWVHWHALRDVYASSLIYSRQDVRVVMTLLGHTSSEETLRVYARLWPEATDGARRALERMWRPPSKGHGRATSRDAPP
jgi:integrase